MSNDLTAMDKAIEAAARALGLRNDHDWQDFLPDAQAAIAAYEAARWQPIETAPKDGKCVMLHGGGVPIAAAYDADKRQWCDWRSSEILYYMDYWMPLPAAPAP